MTDRAAAEQRLSVSGPATVKMTVAALTFHGIDLRHETGLVKAALLYADSVTLLSPIAVAIAHIVQFATADREARCAIADGFTGRLNSASARQYQEMRSRPDSAQEARLFRLMETHEDLDDAHIAAEVEMVLVEAGAQELPKAIAAGVVDIQPIGGHGDLSPSVTTIMLDEIADLLQSYVSTTARTFPLFDDGAGTMLRSMLSSGRVADPETSRAQEAGIAGRLIAGVEAFPDADMDVILDVRERLRKPLVRFRSALSRATAEFSSAAWDQTFPREIDDYYRRQVDPALLDVQECLEELGVRQTLLRMTAGKNALAMAAAAGAATLGLAAFGGIPVELPHLLYEGAGAAALASGGASEARDRGRVRAGAERNPFYFLYQAGLELGGQSR